MNTDAGIVDDAVSMCQAKVSTAYTVMYVLRDMITTVPGYQSAWVETTL